VVAFLPALSVIPLVQHTGGRAYPIVSLGESVREGMLIGRGQGPGSANIHATVPGKVIRLVSRQAAGGHGGDALVIRLEGAFEKLGKREDIYSWEGLSSFELQRIISEYGIVEMEGAGQPVSDMFSALRSARDSLTLVVRCVFDDPWLAADYVLCRERLKAVVEGSIITARACGAKRILYAVSQGERDLGARLAAEAGRYAISVLMVQVGSRYPQRNRRELELVLRMYEKKESVDLGSLLMLGPATLAAVHDAVKLRKPILDRYVAVGGSAVKNPQVMKVRIGTRIGEIFAECGGFTGKPMRIASGSPLQGHRVTDLDEPVVKTSYAVFALLERRIGGTALRGCIGCGECRAVCPVGLDPEELYKRLAPVSPGTPAHPARSSPGFAAKPAAPAPAAAKFSADCHGCGCCEVVCPSRLPLSTTIAALRGR
jgi:electron transport complex protein RnfC